MVCKKMSRPQVLDFLLCKLERKLLFGNIAKNVNFCSNEILTLKVLIQKNLEVTIKIMGKKFFRENKISSVSIPCIHSSRRGYPSFEGAHIAISTFCTTNSQH